MFINCHSFSGYFEELTGYNGFPSFENPGKPDWPVPVYYGEPQVQRRKPCPHRRSSTQAGEPWVPIFRSMVTKPPSNNILEPQALKNENVENTADNEIKVPKSLPAEPSSSNEHNTTDADPNEVSNIDKTNRRPNIEVSPDNNDEASNIDRINRRSNVEGSQDKNDEASNRDGTNRRSNVEETPNNSAELSLSEDYDCDMDLETEDYIESQYGRGQLSVVTSGPTTAKTTAGIEQKVIEMLRDCINKKQKYIEDKISRLDEIPIAGSRRSMGDSDIDLDNDSESVEGADAIQATTDRNEKTTDDLLPITDNNAIGNVTNVPVKEKVTPSFTLRPGKLFNELQNPAKATGIANIATRRMPTDGSRVCYACSTATNPACWEPDNKTTIKYCRIGQNCITKSFGNKSKFF